MGRKIKKILLIFPTRNQLEYIKKQYPNYSVNVVTHNSEWAIEEGYKVITDDIDLVDENVDVLCCHEEGMYWLKSYRMNSWNLQYSDMIFDLLAKDKFKLFLNDNDVKNARFWYEENNTMNYPIIMKPVIGFGSIAVKKIVNHAELEKGLTKWNQEELLKMINPYKDKYFSELENYFILEEYINGGFYRTPFVMINGKIVCMFPIKGIATSFRDNSDFHWTEFELDCINDNMYNSMKDILEKMAIGLKIGTGVFVAEFLVDENCDVYLLELSLRQTSSRICKLVSFATEIDLEKYAIDLFFEKIEELPLIEKVNNVRMQIFREKIEYSDNYRILEIIEEKSVFGDEIFTVYSERKI